MFNIYSLKLLSMIVDSPKIIYICLFDLLNFERTELKPLNYDF